VFHLFRPLVVLLIMSTYAPGDAAKDGVKAPPKAPGTGWAYGTWLCRYVQPDLGQGGFSIVITRTIVRFTSRSMGKESGRIARMEAGRSTQAREDDYGRPIAPLTIEQVEVTTDAPQGGFIWSFRMSRAMGGHSFDMRRPAGSSGGRWSQLGYCEKEE
jgi:hypothetical protein